MNRLFHNCPFLYLVISCASGGRHGSGAGSSLSQADLGIQLCQFRHDTVSVGVLLFHHFMSDLKIKRLPATAQRETSMLQCRARPPTPRASAAGKELGLKIAARLKSIPGGFW